jgi:hypothetical protein
MRSMEDALKFGQFFNKVRVIQWRTKKYEEKFTHIIIIVEIKVYKKKQNAS